MGTDPLPFHLLPHPESSAHLRKDKESSPASVLRSPASQSVSFQPVGANDTGADWQLEQLVGGVTRGKRGRRSGESENRVNSDKAHDCVRWDRGVGEGGDGGNGRK